MFPKMPAQMMMGQQGKPVMGQHPGMMPHGAMPLRMPQGQPFVGGAQPQIPAALGANVARAPGPPGTPAGFFPQGPGMQGADPRLLQERQFQHRMQMAKLQQQQQVMMGQQPMPHPNQQSGVITQPQSGMMGNQLMAQQQANTQQGMLINQANQKSMVQVPQGMVGGQSGAPPQQNLITGQPVNHPQAMMAAQAGIIANQSSQQQRPQVMMGQQGVIGSPGHPGLRGPQAQLTPQQQSILAQRMLASQQQQQNVAKNLTHLQQQQMSQQRHPAQMITQSSQDQGGLSQPSTPQMSSPPSAGSNTPQPQGSTDSQNSGSKEGGILSPDSRTPPQQSGPSTPNQVPQHGSVNDLQPDIGQQQLQQQQHKSQMYVTQHHLSNPRSVHEQQTGLTGNQQTSVPQEQQHQLPLTLQRQGSLSTDKSTLMTIKEEVKSADFVAQQQTAQDATQQSQDPTIQQQIIVQNHPSQPQSVAMGLNPQQQAHMAQQQKQQAMMSMMRAQQQGMMAQRPGVPPGQIRTPINIQAIIAQNPQLRNLPPNQQIQHIQAMIAQRHFHQGQMLRMPVGQGQPSQLRPQAPQVVQQMMPMDGRHMAYGGMGKPGAVASQQQSGMFGQQSNVAPHTQQEMMTPGRQPSQGGEIMQQHIMRDQAPMPRSPMDQGRMVRSASPRQPLANSPGDPQRHPVNQGMRPPTPNHNQQQALMAAATSRVQGSPSHAYSPRVPFGMSPAHPASPHSSHVSSPSIVDSRAGRGSPYNQAKASPLRSPRAKTPLDIPGLKIETQTSGSETSESASAMLNGPEKEMNVRQQLQHVTESHGPHTQQGEFCKLTIQNIKQEPREVQCDGAAEANPGAIKREATGEMVTSGNNPSFINAGNMTRDPEAQGPRSETGQQLLQKLLKTKNLQLGAQRPSEGIHNEINGHINSKLAMLEQKLQGTPRNMEVCFSKVCYFF